MISASYKILKSVPIRYMKLVYFNARGLAETSRLLFALSEEPYEDFRYPLEVIDMKTFNLKKDEFDYDKLNGKLIKSLNKVPYLEVDNEIIPQSKTIERYLAKRFNMMGNNLIEEAKIDAICECVRDIKDLYQKVRRISDEHEKKIKMGEWFSLVLPERLGLLEKTVNSNYSVGNSLSLSDVVIYSLITQFFDNKEGAMNAILKHNNLKSIVLKIGDDQRIKSWLQNRPDTNL